LKEAIAMTTIHDWSRYRSRGLMLALMSGFLLFWFALAAQAAPADGRDPGRRDSIRSNPGRPNPIQRNPGRPNPPQREFHDSRYQHDRSYPVRGGHIVALPRDHRVVVHNGSRFYFSGGAWYGSLGSRFVVVAPPIGLFIPFLPPFYTTIWVGGAPYYYANEVYYGHRGNGYVVVEPPKEEVSQAPPPAEQMFIYPRQGQSEAQQATDRYECHRWAVEQTGFDPTQPASLSDAQRGEKRADYQRAMAACLDGRGYTVK
jgi:hypothetical protein